jgi:AraC-like DNA-binding protein
MVGSAARMKSRASANALHLNRARDFIFAHYDGTLDLDTLAREARLSPFHFQRTFTARFGESPHACATRARLERAKDLLLNSELPVTDICFQVGFESLGSFSSLFNKRVGSPPSAYRRRLRRLIQVPEALTSRFIPFCYVERYVELAP